MVQLYEEEPNFINIHICEMYFLCVRKDFKFRVPFSCLTFAFFLGLFTLLAHEIFPEAPLWGQIVTGLGILLLVVIVTVFVVSTTNTLKGYAAFMARKPNPDGSVSDPRMLD